LPRVKSFKVSWRVSCLCTIALAHPTPVRIPGILWRRDAEMMAGTRAFLAILRGRARSRKSACDTTEASPIEASEGAFDDAKAAAPVL